MEAGEGMGWAAAIEATALAVALKQSAYLYPFVNVGHVLGIALVAGAITALDLRFLGFGKGLDLEAAERLLRGVAFFGLLVAIPTGLLMFVADAVALSQSATFIAKILLVAAALANALLFVLLWRKARPSWDARPPVLGRIQAAASLVLWLGAVSAGRLIAYF